MHEGEDPRHLLRSHARLVVYDPAFWAVQLWIAELVATRARPFSGADGDPGGVGLAVDHLPAGKYSAGEFARGCGRHAHGFVDAGTEILAGRGFDPPKIS